MTLPAEGVAARGGAPLRGVERARPRMTGESGRRRRVARSVTTE